MMKSGKIRLQIGGIEYIVTEGVPCKNRCELHWVNLGTNDCVFVGDVDVRAVAALDLAHMLKTLKT